MNNNLPQYNFNVISKNLWPTIFETGLVYIFWFLIIIFLLLIAKRILKKYIKNNKFFDHTVYLVRVPREKPENKEKDFSPQELKEQIAKAEIIFSGIGGLRAQIGIKAWLFGRNDHFSFEIVANNKKIAFYIVAPKNTDRYIEQQIHAHYPEAIIEEVKDYNIFKPQSKILAGFLTTRRNFLFPIKTYTKMETDPLNSVINVMSKLEKNEGLAIQYIIRSAKPSWHQQAGSINQKLQAGKNLKEILKTYNRSWFSNAIFDIFYNAKPTKSEQVMTQTSPRLSQMEEEMLKGIEEKNSKAGLDVNLRIIVSALDKGRANIYLNNLSSAYAQFNYYEYGNSFQNKIKTNGRKKLINNFIYRRFNRKTAFLLNSEELASLYHLPNRSTQTPNILWLTAKLAPAPNNIPTEGLTLGNNIYRGQKTEIKITREDRRRHMYVIGKSGTGKSQFMASMAIQDIINGEGVCVLDPHGDLIADILERIPRERVDDVIIFSPADIERPLALNLVEFDPRYPEQKTFVINEMIKIFDKLYDLKSTGGPIFEQYMRNALLLIMSDPESGSTLMEVPKVLADPEFRKMKLERCNDQTVVDFWRKEAEKAGGDAALANVVPYVTSKLTQFISNDTMRPIIGQQKSSFNMRDLMDNQKILLIDLSKGQVGETNAFLLGMILIGKILMSALSRTDIPQNKRKDFYLYIDEFQNFTTDSINSILSEARKYGLNLIIAHQYLGQLAKGQDTSIKEAVFGNVGTWCLFKIGSEDAEILEKEFTPVFNQFDLINIEKYTVYTKLLINNTATRPFSMLPTWPLPGTPLPEIAKKIKSLSRLKYGRDRSLIEAQIMSRASNRSVQNTKNNII